jgi:hypothetical protein
MKTEGLAITGLLVGGILLQIGCAGSRQGRTGAGRNPSTLEHNLRALPRGRMIGPPGLGTDLASRSAGQGASKAQDVVED